MSEGEFPVPVRGVVTLLDDDSYAARWRGPLVEAGVLLLEVDVGGVRESTTLFARLTDALALPRGVRVAGWSGLEDYLRQRVATWEMDGAMIVLRRINDMLHDLLGDLLEMMSVLRDLATDAGSDEQNFPNEVAVRIALTGSGRSFPDAL